jgi:GxxExxY protein
LSPGVPLDPSVNQLTFRIIACAIAVHRALGPGLLESAYLACMVAELRSQGLHVELGVPVPLVYRGLKLNCGYRLDMLVEGIVILELKTVTAILPIHEAQLMTYLRLTAKPVGLILNFNVAVMKDGIKRKINTA